MKKFWGILVGLAVAAVTVAEVPVHYYVGNTRVDNNFWLTIPDSLKSGRSHFEYDSLVVESCELVYTHYLDSVSEPGQIRIVRRPDSDISIIELSMGQAISASRASALRLSVGDDAPQIRLMKNINGEVIDNVIVKGKCYLLSFWATWCGNCLKELQPEYIPSVAANFENNNDFIFLPVCIDSSRDELAKFFSTSRGARWKYLSQITALDISREANAKFSSPGIMPVNVVIGADGKVKYIHSGSITDAASLSRLRDAIAEGVPCYP